MSLDALYYRMALVRALSRDLSGAAAYARTALLLNDDNERAARLLNAVLYALNGPPDALNALTGILPLPDKKSAVAGLFARLRAMSVLRGMYQCVRVLNIQGCLYAMSGRYDKAAVFFAMALEKDCGNALAAAALTDAVSRGRGLSIKSLGK